MPFYEDNHALMPKGSFGFNTMHIDREIYFPGLEEDLQMVKTPTQPQFNLT